MPLGWLKSVLDGRKKRKPMGDKRKKRKSAHFSDAKGVDSNSLAGQARARNERVKSQMDELD